MWVWMRSTYVGVSPLCIAYAISFHSIAYARLYVSALCMPCYLVHRVCHFIALCMLGCILVAFHAYHAYCIVLGIGISPDTRNEVRFVLRVTKRVSIPQSPTLRIIHDGVRSCCVYTCIHSILSCTFWLLCHHASICVIGGTRIEACIYLWKYIAMPLSCSLLQQNEESTAFRSLARISRTGVNRG